MEKDQNQDNTDKASEKDQKSLNQDQKTENLETNKKSPTNKFGFIEPEGILNGSIAKVLITPAIIKAQKSALKLLIKDDLILLNNYRRNRMLFCIR